MTICKCATWLHHLSHSGQGMKKMLVRLSCKDYYQPSGLDNNLRINILWLKFRMKQSSMTFKQWEGHFL